MSRYETCEHTGIESIDREIDTLRSERDEAAQKQYDAQSRIDELFLNSMLPDIKCGDYICYDKDDRVTTGRVSGLRRNFGGVTIEFDIVAYILSEDTDGRANSRMTLSKCERYHESVSLKKEDLGSIRKITREQFIGCARVNFEDIMKATKETESVTQLKLDI